VLRERAAGAFVRSESAGRKVVAVVGLDDVIVVDTDDALLVCRKGSSQDVREIVEKLRKGGHGSLV
jgi:mannose-1-phosphate guanylyltransferase